MAVRRSVQKNITGQDQWTDWLMVEAGGLASISITGTTFAGTVTVQRRLDGANSRDAAEYVDPTSIERTFMSDEANELRVGVKSGAFSLGSVNIRLGT